MMLRHAHCLPKLAKNDISASVFVFGLLDRLATILGIKRYTRTKRYMKFISGTFHVKRKSNSCDLFLRFVVGYWINV